MLEQTDTTFTCIKFFFYPTDTDIYFVIYLTSRFIQTHIFCFVNTNFKCSGQYAMYICVCAKIVPFCMLLDIIRIFLWEFPDVSDEKNVKADSIYLQYDERLNDFFFFFHKLTYFLPNCNSASFTFNMPYWIILKILIIFPNTLI